MGRANFPTRSLIQLLFPPFIHKEIHRQPFPNSTCTMPPLPLHHNFCRSPFRTATLTISSASTAAQFIQFQFQFQLSRQNFRGKPLIAAAVSGTSSVNCDQPSIVLDSLRVLQWDQLCDCVASFAGTTLGKQATKVYMHI